MLTEGRFESPQSGALLAQICSQLQDRAAKHPEMGIKVELSDSSGIADFGWGRCLLQAGSDALALRIEAADADDVERLKELFTRHIERHSADREPAVVWDGSRERRSALDPHRKDLMRSFHRRTRQ